MGISKQTGVPPLPHIVALGPKYILTIQVQLILRVKAPCMFGFRALRGVEMDCFLLRPGVDCCRYMRKNVCILTHLKADLSSAALALPMP